jgi:hypothetical protein
MVFDLSLPFLATNFQAVSELLFLTGGETLGGIDF